MDGPGAQVQPSAVRDAPRLATGEPRAAAVSRALIVTDQDGAVLEANAAAGALLGVPHPHLRCRPVLAYVPPAQRRTARDLLSRVLREGSARDRVVLRSRSRADLPVDAVVTAIEGVGPVPAAGTAALHWVLVPAGERAPAGAGPLPAAGGAPEPDQDALLALAGLCHLPIGEVEATALLARVAVLARRAVRGAGGASVVLGDPRSPEGTGSDSPRAQAVDGLTVRTGEGPCVRAWQDAVPVVCDDLATDGRWPGLAPLVAGSGVRGALAVPLRVDGRVVGVLTLYSPAVGGLSGDGDLERALLFTAAAGALLEDARRLAESRSTAEQMRQAMSSRASIEQAKGMVAAWLGCTVEEAFAVLTAMSQDRNVKLRSLAARVLVERAGARRAVVEQHRRLAAGRAAAPPAP
ncbi:GAF and ANTAR domain-containing protein [Quadrisphaera sp. DSM 44207]|uniref:GAF and ANTAR domain-containing protein n=1 Tax=Quadrisphaera sp. DSM 44207 TaxID=1881057 RepID=UPI00088129FC|nr:GAF and ANTAR domain-containing protein [Quadrisphaera sp. DSM 44207]SDQ23609.1 PAS fold-containing protein [Quadrisphaera sp. DSM 44207]